MVLGLLLTVACGGSSTSTVGGSSDGGAAGGDGGAGSPLANGMCSFTIAQQTYDLPGFANMNGSGNLVIQCATSAVSMELDVGNGSYQGPGQFSFSPKLRDGSLTITTATARYEAGSGNNIQTACTVTVSTAPVSDYPPAGSAIGGTFSCTAVPRYPVKNPDAGTFASASDGAFDIQSGAFNLAIR